MKTILLYAAMATLLVLMTIRTGKLFIRSRKNKAMLNILALLDTEEDFYQAADTYIHTEKSAEFIAKVEVLRLFADAYYNKEQTFLSHLESFDPSALLNKNNENEDSFFYLYLAIPNRLWYNDRMNLNNLLEKKMLPLQNKKQNLLSFAMHQANHLYYTNQEDGGKAFDESILNGEYGSYSYSKQLIALYKCMAATALVRIAKDHHDGDTIRSYTPLLQNFRQSRLGSRWLIEWRVDDVIPSISQKGEIQ